jgi:Holliday junction resolvase-like predicted endonuclease
MNSTTLVKKASGEKEPFSLEKLENSLLRTGADREAVNLIADKISNWLHDGVSTKKIYRKAFKLLKKHRNGVAARYQLRKAIMELGPTGYPFEHFVGQVIRQLGYEVKVGQILQGHCVTHEVDVVATNDDIQIFVECKFYNSQSKHASVQVPLYIHSRVEDIIKTRKLMPEYSNFSFQGWVVTNTRFTTDATDYGKCAGLNMISWDYPAGRGLKDIIEKEGLFPVTTFTTLNKLQKQILLDEGIVLCRQICQSPGIIEKIEVSPQKREKILKEVRNLCTCGNCTS